LRISVAKAHSYMSPNLATDHDQIK
jgi:hypothetical protein